MNLQTILIIIGCSILVVLILFFVFVSIRKKKQNKTLDENLKKIQQENKNFDKGDAELVISNDEEVAKTEDYLPVEEESEEEIKPEVTPVVEDYDPDLEFEKEFKKVKKKRMNDDFFGMTSKGKQTKKDSMEEFEDFLDQHSYTRRILDKDVISNIEGLSPQMRQALLNKLFNKVDD